MHRVRILKRSNQPRYRFCLPSSKPARLRRPQVGRTISVSSSMVQNRKSKTTINNSVAHRMPRRHTLDGRIATDNRKAKRKEVIVAANLLGLTTIVHGNNLRIEIDPGRTKRKKHRSRRPRASRYPLMQRSEREDRSRSHTRVDLSISQSALLNPVLVIITDMRSDISNTVAALSYVISGFFGDRTWHQESAPCNAKNKGPTRKTMSAAYKPTSERWALRN